MHIWRISDFASLSGEGGILYPARWNHRGSAIVYCTDHPATAMLELLVNADLAELSQTYQLLRIEFPNSLRVEEAVLPDGWASQQNLTRDYWDDFCERAEAPILRVPTVIVPHALNYLINPAHADSGRIKIAEATHHFYDARFRR